MAREAVDVTETELGLMQALWDLGRCSTRQITERLYPGGTQAQYATVQKLLERLEAKGFTLRDRTHFVHTFTAAVGRDELIGRRLRGLADKLCGGSLVPILSHLARNPSLSDEERQSLRDLIAQPDEAAGPNPAPRGRRQKR